MVHKIEKKEKISEAYNIITQFIGDSDLDDESKKEANEQVNILYDIAKGKKVD